MSLQTHVKAGNITNLTDARYCAGMGVEIIGFPIGKSNVQAIEPAKIKEILGWVSGIKIALEFIDSEFDKEFISGIIQELKPDYFQVSYTLQKELKKITDIPLLLSTSESELLPIDENDILIYTGNIQSDLKTLADLCLKNKVILSGNQINVNSVQKILTDLKPYGIELKGGNEISPGLKSFEALSEILELLEVDE
jgi:phosphoribosylanthranilate isomerase